MRETVAMYSAFFLASLGLFLDFAEAVFPSKLLHTINLVFVIFIMDPYPFGNCALVMLCSDSNGIFAKLSYKQATRAFSLSLHFPLHKAL